VNLNPPVCKVSFSSEKWGFTNRPVENRPSALAVPHLAKGAIILLSLDLSNGKG
jgi:hypothetical protein